MTTADLARVTDDKAESIDGKIVLLLHTGRKPGRVAGRIYRSLDDYATASGQGEACPDKVGLMVPRLESGRQSFTPDAPYHFGPFPADPIRFFSKVSGVRALAVEVRRESDYGPAALAELAAKRDDYFEAGTKIVWDVDPIAEEIHVYRAEAPDQPITFQSGRIVDAEPLLPGWRVQLDWIFA